MNPACISCGFENPRAWRTCARCGETLSGVKAPTGVLAAAATRAGSGAPRSHASFAELPPEDTAVDFLTPDGLRPEGDASVEHDACAPGPVLFSGAPLAPDSDPPLIGQVQAADAIRAGVERALCGGTPTLVALEGGSGSG